MTIGDIKSFAAGTWVGPDDAAREIRSAIDGTVIARAGNSARDTEAMLDYARSVVGPALRKMTFHDRAKMLKALALHLAEHKQELYDISFATGATQKDHLIDVDGGIGTMLVFASKGRREMPDDTIYLDGGVEMLSRNGTFLGQHICTPLRGVAVHINADNFPVWGMLEKLAPTLLAGVPAIVKPATASCYVAERAMRLMLDSGILPPGAAQLVSGGLGDMLATCSSQLSRNYRVGYGLAQGKTLEQVLAGLGGTAEGVNTAHVLIDIANREGILAPISRQVDRLLSDRITPQAAVEALMERDLKPESCDL